MNTQNKKSIYHLFSSYPPEIYPLHPINHSENISVFSIALSVPSVCCKARPFNLSNALRHTRLKLYKRIAIVSCRTPPLPVLSVCHCCTIPKQETTPPWFIRRTQLKTLHPGTYSVKPQCLFSPVSSQLYKLVLRTVECSAAARLEHLESTLPI